MNENNEVQYLKPFKRFCMSIGELPTSYLETMSYYEMLVWLTKYLGEQVIPTVNNNGEVVSELQSFVENYFDNLDVQEEIDNKLDEMVADGTFEELIADYTTIPELTSRVQTLEDNEKTEMVVIGDSFSSRTYLPDTTKKLWCERVAERLGLNLHNYADPGSGFVADGDERQSTFNTQINEAYNDTSFDNSKVAYVFIYGGTNDLRYSDTTTKSNFTSAYDTAFSNAREKFPNAKIVYLGSTCFATFYTKAMSDGETITELWVDTTIKDRQVIKDSAVIFDDLTLFYLGQSSYFTDSYSYHPNYVAHKDFAEAVLNSLFSSANAFHHVASTTPEVTSTSSSYVTLGNTLTGQNQWVLIITNREIRAKLITYMAIPTRQGYYRINFPYGLRIPYNNKDYFDFKNNLANALVFGDTHTQNGVVSNGMVPTQVEPGYNYITMYNDEYDASQNYDIYFDFMITY